MKRTKDKTFDMMRSILPSTARKGTRDDKRILHKKNRAEIREILETCDDWDDAAMLDHCWTPRFMPGWDTIVYDRRASDKLHHFERWAEKITSQLPADERMDYMRSIVPPTVIGEHALSHLRF